MSEYTLNKLLDDIKDFNMILIGIGGQCHHIEAVNMLKDALHRHNYFLITTKLDFSLSDYDGDKNRVCYPQGVDDSMEFVNWDEYTKWLSYTLNQKLLLIEIEEDFQNPNIIRWAFEKITFFNQKSKFIRINKNLAHIPSELTDRGISVFQEGKEFFTINKYSI